MLRCVSLARGPIFLSKNNTMDFCLCDAILNLKAFCFGAIPAIKIRVANLWDCITKHDYRVYLLQGPSKGPHNLTSTGPRLS